VSARKPRAAMLRVAQGVSVVRPRIEIDSSPAGDWRAHQALVHRIAALVLEESGKALGASTHGWNVEIDHGRTSFDSSVCLELYEGTDHEALLGSKVLAAVVAKYNKAGVR
jgi:hypothetical protein